MGAFPTAHYIILCWEYYQVCILLSGSRSERGRARRALTKRVYNNKLLLDLKSRHWFPDIFEHNGNFQKNLVSQIRFKVLNYTLAYAIGSFKLFTISKRKLKPGNELFRL